MFQDDIADGMTIGIVDEFEPIQIDQGQYALFVITPGGRKRSVNDLVDPAPIQNAAK